MNVIRHYVGNTSPALYYRIRVPVEEGSAEYEPYPIPAGADVTFYLREMGTETLRIDGAAATVVNPSATLPTHPDAGRLRYDWQPADVVGPAEEFVGWFRVTLPGGAAQDTPEFVLDLEDHFDGGVGTYTSVASLKDFTGIDELKSASSEWLAGNVIPRAEAWLTAFGPFDSATCPALGLAANMLAEAIFDRLNPAYRNRSLAATGQLKSESIGDYSYTLNDVANGGEGATAWDLLLQEVDLILASCRLLQEDTEVMWASAGEVFLRQPGVTYGPAGELTGVFSVEDEIMVIGRRLTVWR